MCVSCRVEQCSVRCAERPTGRNRRCAPTSHAHIPPTPHSPAPSAPPPFSPSTVSPNIRAHSMSCLPIPACCCLASNLTCCLASNPASSRLAPNPTWWYLAPNPTCWQAPNPTWWRASTVAAGFPQWDWTRIWGRTKTAMSSTGRWRRLRVRQCRRLRWEEGGWWRRAAPVRKGRWRAMRRPPATRCWLRVKQAQISSWWHIAESQVRYYHQRLRGGWIVKIIQWGTWYGTTRARICKHVRSPGIDSASHVSWLAGTITLLDARTGPPGDKGWRNRFLGSLNVYKFGLCSLITYDEHTIRRP